jgi:hypothetical protein
MCNHLDGTIPASIDNIWSLEVLELWTRYK